MSRLIKSEIESVKDDICVLEEECDALYYEVYVRHRRLKLFEYELTLKELNKAERELERLTHEYKVELRREQEKRRVALRKEHDNMWENKTQNMHSMSYVVPQDPPYEPSIGEIFQNIENLIIAIMNKNVEQGVSNISETLEKSSTSHVENVSSIQEVEEVPVIEEENIGCKGLKVVDVEHIEFVVPEHLLQPPPSLNPFLKFFLHGLVSSLKCRKCFLVPFHSYMVLAFYKTRGRVFSNKGRMMGNENIDKKIVYLLVNSLLICSIGKYNMFINLVYTWG